MVGSVSSSQPQKLIHYSDVAVRIDHELVSDSHRLGSTLQHFEATCTEYRVHVSYLSDEIRNYARRYEGTDRWVRDVGERFEAADRRSWLEIWWEQILSVLAPDRVGISAALLLLLGRYVDRGVLIHPGGPLYREAGLVLKELREGGAPIYVGLTSLLTGIGISSLDAAWKFFKVDYKTAKGLLEIRDIARGLKIAEGSTYPGQIKFYGSHELMEMIGWSPNLRHMSGGLANLWKLSRQTGWSTLHPTDMLGWGFLGITVIERGIANWHEYKDEGLGKVAIGTAVDSALTIGLTAVGATAGAFAGGLIGGPVGVAYGGKIGGVVGNLAGHWVAKTDFYKEQKGKLVDAIARIGKESGREKSRVDQITPIAQESPAPSGFAAILEQQSPPPAPLNTYINPAEFSSCALYAQARRPGLGRTGASDGGADGYISKFRDEIVGIGDGDTDLTTKVAEGYAVVWPRDSKWRNSWPDQKFGHVAIIEEVHPDYIIVSHANAGPPTMKIERDELGNVSEIVIIGPTIEERE